MKPPRLRNMSQYVLSLTVISIFSSSLISLPFFFGFEISSNSSLLSSGFSSTVASSLSFYESLSVTVAVVEGSSTSWDTSRLLALCNEITSLRVSLSSSSLWVPTAVIYPFFIKTIRSHKLMKSTAWVTKILVFSAQIPWKTSLKILRRTCISKAEIGSSIKITSESA